MLKKLLILITGSTLCLFSSCKEEATFLIKVKLDNLKGENVYAVFEADDRKWVDTLFNDGSGELTVTQTQADYRTLTLYFENQTQWITVYLEPHKKITLKGDILYPQLVKVKGGKTNEWLSGFHEKAAALLKERTDLSKAMHGAQEKLRDEHISRWANINQELCQQAETFIRKHPGEEASAILIREYLSDPETPLRTEAFLALLNPELDDFHVVKELKASNEKAKLTMKGAAAPDFSVLNINRVHFNKNSFSNRYCILAFVHNEHQTRELLLDEIVTTYPDDSLSVMLISLDESPQQVREQVRKDTIPWNIVTDSAGQAIGMIDLYNVNRLPLCYLIDKEGNIRLKTENGIELEQVLSELMTGK
ncbi:MAG: redoxin domain-containing protein [Tannerella sp.]|jgi:peroxiredoxin|nr:redoxin domain-containing protein [Tannerella sp.]